MRNTAAKWGVIYGLLSIGITLILYLIDKPLLFSVWSSAIMIVLPIVMLYFSITQTREEQGGYISFTEALTAGMLTYVIGTLLSTIFTFILYSYIDTSLIDIQNEIAIETMQSTLESFGVDDEDIEDNIEDFEEQLSPVLTLGQALGGWFLGLFIPGLLYGIAMSLLLKKRNPEEDIDFDN